MNPDLPPGPLPAPRPFPRHMLQRPPESRSRPLDEIYPNLWLGSLQDAESAEVLRALSITDVISITSHRPRIPPGLQITKTHFRLRDNTAADLLSILPECIRRIEDALAAARRVLVHCRMGISRSGGMVVAYAMKRAGMPAALALEYVRSRRPVVNPNRAFMAQLTVWGECGFDTALLMPDMLPEGGGGGGGEEEDEEEEEMLRRALEMSLAGRQVVNPDLPLPQTALGVSEDANMVDAPPLVSSGLLVLRPPAGAGATTAKTAVTATAATTATDTTTDTDTATSTPNTPTILDLHPAQRQNKTPAAEGEAEEQWTKVTMADPMRRCFDECVRDVGVGGG